MLAVLHTSKQTEVKVEQKNKRCSHMKMTEIKVTDAPRHVKQRKTFHRLLSVSHLGTIADWIIQFCTPIIYNNVVNVQIIKLVNS